MCLGLNPVTGKALREIGPKQEKRTRVFLPIAEKEAYMLV